VGEQQRVPARCGGVANVLEEEPAHELVVFRSACFGLESELPGELGEPVAVVEPVVEVGAMSFTGCWPVESR
jgi:hypothetical protein